MIKKLIPILSLPALFSLHGCSTVPEAKPRPAPGPEAHAMVEPHETIPRPAAPQPTVTIEPSADTGGERATGAGKLEKVVVKPIIPDGIARSRTEKEKTITPSGKPRPAAAEKPQAVATKPPPVSPQPAEPSAQLPAAPAPQAGTVKALPPAPKAPAAPPSPAKAETPQQPSPPTITTPAGKAAKAAAPGLTPAKDFSRVVFAERTLPMALEHGWTLARQRDLVDGASRCVLLSPAFTIFDGYYPAKARLGINPVRAWVRVNSNIDTSYPEQGLRVDGGALVPFAAQLADAQTAYTKAPVLHCMAGAHTLTVALGFWPTWPKTKMQTARIELAGFGNSYTALRECSQQQQAAASDPALRGVAHDHEPAI